MAISQFTDTGVQTAQFSHVNSGYQPTTAGPTTNSFAFNVTSGNCLLQQYQLASGQNQKVDLCSGGLTDLVGDSLNSAKLYNVQFLGLSGGTLVETWQSGAVRLPIYSTQSGFPQSGFGALLTPGDSIKLGQSASGQWQPLSAGQQNVNFRAVSGNAMFQVGFLMTN